MAGFNIDAQAFRCSTEEFATQLAETGISGAGTGRYYLMPEAVTFLQRNAQRRAFPYSMPPASRRYQYGPEMCPNAVQFLETFIRWSTFCEKYQPEHCELAAKIVREVAEKNRR
jgi:hypothetical protein